MRRLALPLLALLCLSASATAQSVPSGNDPRLSTPPPRPELGDAATRAAGLFEAIRTDDPSRGMDLFLPRDAFRAIKGVGDPDRFYDRLVRLFERDVHALHESTSGLEGAELVALRFSRRRSWVEVRQEANRLPYWAQRRSELVYRVAGEERSLSVHTMIAWDGRWFITHLSDHR